MVSIDIFKTIVLTLESAIQKSQILYINSRSASVRPSDATVPRFNSPAEPARTVGFEKRDSTRTVGFGKTRFGPVSWIRKPGSERTRDSGRIRQRSDRQFRVLIHRTDSSPF
jgi:hypothetical protein